MRNEIFEGTPFDGDTIADIVRKIGKNIRLLTLELPGYVGSVLFGVDDEAFGVYLGDQSIFGFTSGSPQARFIPWENFGARFTWYPFLP